MKEFLKNMLSAESGVSSKRFNGTIYGFLVIIIVLLTIMFGWEIEQPQENLLQTVFWGALLLFGATSAEKFIKNEDRTG